MRAQIELADVGVIEVNPFTRSGFSRGEWPDGTYHPDQRPYIRFRWAVEREPGGWFASLNSQRIALVEDERVRVDALSIVLRRIDLPLHQPRISVSGVELIDTPWPLHPLAPRRVGILDGGLVEVLHRTSSSLHPPDDYVLHIKDSSERTWDVFRAHFEVPLRWIVAAGVPVPSQVETDIDEYVVGLEGRLRRVPNETSTSRNWAGVQSGPSLRDGLVGDLFPERLREWRAIETCLVA